MTLDMESVFRRKVEEKEEKMVRTSKEEEEKVRLSRKELEEVKEVVERRRAELEEEKRAWESENNTSLAGILLAGEMPLKVVILLREKVSKKKFLGTFFPKQWIIHEKKG